MAVGARGREARATWPRAWDVPAELVAAYEHVAEAVLSLHVPSASDDGGDAVWTVVTDTVTGHESRVIKGGRATSVEVGHFVKK